MPRSKEQLDKLKEEKKESIMNAALEMFALKGYENTSISSIAKQANISKGLIYNYFKSKEDLLRQIIIGGMNKFSEHYENIETTEFDEKTFTKMIHKSFEIIENNPQHWTLYFSLMMQPGLMKLVEKEIQKFIEIFMQKITNYYQSKGEKNAYAKARLLGATLDGVSANYLLDKENVPLSEIKELIIKMFI